MDRLIDGLIFSLILIASVIVAVALLNLDKETNVDSIKVERCMKEHIGIIHSDKSYNFMLSYCNKHKDEY